MKKQKNKIAKVAALSGMCAFAGLSAHAFGLDVDVHANGRQGIGASVDADVGLARANIGANLDSTGVDADVGADVIGVGANAAGHVGFDGVKARANTYAWNVADVGANAGATWKDGVYVGGTAKFLEPANTANVALQNGQAIYVPNKPAPRGCAWVYDTNGRIVGYKPIPRNAYVPQVVQMPVAHVQPQPVRYVQPTYVQPVGYQVQPVTYRVEQRVFVPAEATEMSYSHERLEQNANGNTYQKNNFYQFQDPNTGYSLTDKRQYIRRTIRPVNYR